MSVGRCVQAALVLAATLIAGDAAAVKISVKGTATLEGRVVADGDAQMIRGVLRDDVGSPVSGARVTIDVLTLEGKPVLTLPAPMPCTTQPGGHPPRSTSDAYSLDSDAQGVFCVRAAQFPSRGILRLRFGGRPGLSAASAELPFDAERPMPTLSWDPRPEMLDLDLPQAKVSVVAASRSAGGRPLEGLALALRDEGGKVISRAKTDERGRATFEVLTSQVSGPGQGELEVRAQDGGGGLLPLKARVLRSARVTLVATPPEGAIVPHDGHRFEAVAETSRGPAPGGAIEARIGGEVVGAGSVQGGRASVVTTFDVPSEGQLDFMFTYLSASPELRPGEPLLLRVAVKPPSLWRKAPLLGAGLLLLLWLARGWRRPPRTERTRGEATEASGEGRPPPLPAFVEVAERGARGWRGVVLDAHTHQPIEGATVAVVSRDFLGERRVAECQVDEGGRFEIEASWEPQRVLVIESRYHARAERPLPKPGRVNVGMVLRRRVVLERLLAAVRRAGGWAAGGEPTPGQVAKGLEAQSRPAGAKWAKAVEEAAFSQEPLDAEGEARVASLETDLSRRDGADWVRR